MDKYLDLISKTYYSFFAILIIILFKKVFIFTPCLQKSYPPFSGFYLLYKGEIIILGASNFFSFHILLGFYPRCNNLLISSVLKRIPTFHCFNYNNYIFNYIN